MIYNVNSDLCSINQNCKFYFMCLWNEQNCSSLFFFLHLITTIMREKWAFSWHQNVVGNKLWSIPRLQQIWIICYITDKEFFLSNETQSPSSTKKQGLKCNFSNNLIRWKTSEMDYLCPIKSKSYFRVWHSIIFEKRNVSPYTDAISSEMFIKAYH